MTDKQPELPEHPEMAPDPDEDDLSDLDDMLEEFSTTNINDKPAIPAPVPPPASASAPTAPAAPTAASATSAAPPPQLPSLEDNDFANQLQAGMADLLGQLDSNPDMQKQFEAMMSELTSAAQQEAAQPQPTPAAPSTSEKAAPNASFQDTIRKTMERMQTSGDTASAAAANSSDDDMLAQMLKELESGQFSGLEGENSEDFNKMLMGMMEQLTNKDILYEPMKELHDKFPDWLEKNRASVSNDDLARYNQQQTIVKDIVARFEKSNYSDGNKEDREYIVEKMQQMQAAGSPPPDLVGDMGAAQDALGDMDGGCNQQ